MNTTFLKRGITDYSYKTKHDLAKITIGSISKHKSNCRGKGKEKTFQLFMYLHSLINRGQGNNTVQYTKTFNNKII
jgi:hypothetical protein